jgi:hypothetical protein
MATDNPTVGFDFSLLDDTDDGGKKRSNASSLLITFLASEEPGAIIPTEVMSHDPKEMVQHFKNAGKATRHDDLLDAPVYVIPGGYHVVPKIVNGDLWLINVPLAKKLQAEQAAKVATR